MSQVFEDGDKAFDKPLSKEAIEKLKDLLGRDYKWESNLNLGNKKIN